MFRARLLLTSALVLLVPGPAQAGATFELRDLGGCRIPILEGAKSDSEVANTLEEGNLVLATKEGQHSLFWFPGANAAMTDEVLGFYVQALAEGSGAWIGSEEVVWTEVDGNRAARLPIKISGQDQKSIGLMLIWASVSTGRYFMYVLTPAMKGSKQVWDSATLEAMVTQAASMISCEGAERVKDPVALIDPIPTGWWADETDLPRMKYGRRDRKQTIVLWAGRWRASKFECADAAQPLFDRFMEDPRLDQAGEAQVEVENSDGAQGRVYCRVEASITGWSEAQGDRIVYTQWACPDRADRMAAAIELIAGDIPEDAYLDPMPAAKCLDEMPEKEPVLKVSDEPKEQWVPQKKEKKRK